MHTLLPLDFMQMGFFLYSRSLPQYENIIVEQRQTIWMLGSCLIILLIVFLVMVVVIGIFICRFRNRKSTNNPPLLSVSAEKREHLDSIYTLIYQYVVTEKHYLDKDIDISEVARHCNIGKDLVNKALVSKKNMTLLDFVNSYRIEYAGNLLLTLPIRQLKSSQVKPDSTLPVPFYGSLNRNIIFQQASIVN